MADTIKFHAYDFKVQNLRGGDEFSIAMKVPVQNAPSVARLLIEAMRTGQVADVTINFFDPNNVTNVTY